MNQLIMILLISLLVLVHEAGHFLAAKLFGVRVTRFGIGMPIGPSWKLAKLGHTTIYLHAFLFGGYVSFADDEKQFCEDEKKELDEDEILSQDSPELYENKTIPQKLLIVSAGVIMNVIFAVILVIFCAIFYHRLPTSSQNLYIDSFVNKTSSNISQLGAVKGDKFVKVNGFEVENFYTLTFFTRNSKLFDNYAQKSLVEQNLSELKKLNPSIKDEVSLIKEGTIIKLPQTKAEEPLNVNKNVLKGFEKYKPDGILLTNTTIKLRDEIYSKKSFKSHGQINLSDVAMALSDTYKPLSITVFKEGQYKIISNVIVGKEGLLGTALIAEDVFDQTRTPKDIIVKSFNYLYTTTKTMLQGLWYLIVGKVSASQMHGVIAVVKVGGDIIASKGMLNGILLTAMISINLAIMNFLPIPALDGGHVMFLIIEKLTGKKPSKELSEKITNFFFFLLIILMVVICYNDIFALVTKKF